MDALSFYDVDNVALITTLDLGEVAPSSSDDITLRVVNISDQHQADDVTVSTDAPGLLLSVDGEVFTASIDVGGIVPKGTSAPFVLRRVTASTEHGGGSATLTATPAAWTGSFDQSTSDNIPLDTES